VAFEDATYLDMECARDYSVVLLASRQRMAKLAADGVTVGSQVEQGNVGLSIKEMSPDPPSRRKNKNLVGACGKAG
jgi:hypothetical protein